MKPPAEQNMLIIEVLHGRNIIDYFSYEKKCSFLCKIFSLPASNMVPCKNPIDHCLSFWSRGKSSFHLWLIIVIRHSTFRLCLIYIWASFWILLLFKFVSAQWPGLWMAVRLKVTFCSYKPLCFCHVNAPS